ncbi:MULTISPECIES: transcription antitermination factor NusB [Myroides]|uniref:Transcription antitermination factor NusB n=1 Tax=Myroides albus TaxID=2562892 RepID=A0A6I3LNZ9_9FLAO|nr:MULTISPECIES: transcription antitermination factor NusB [Myroides]MTG97705.1 transcription antitermination factor NusB [Myroides albus]MVX34655.1 transcription antitermination factor NusB [Myroides sp. LoEW2-1]UVD78749.1 transcription antitermination factor NusB [Myroides albus]
MLNRRHIRIKVMQSLYMMQQSNSENIQVGEKFLNNSIEDVQDLYLLVLTTLVEVRKKEEEYISIAQKKHLATSAERNPNKRLIENSVLLLLENSISITSKLEEKKLTQWSVYDNYITMLLEEIKESDIYKSYMAKSSVTFEDDRDFVVDIFTEIIAPNEKIYSFFEDYKLTWLDDLPVINTLIQKQLKKLKERDTQVFVPKIFKDEEDADFATNLYRKTILNFQELFREFEDKTPNWDADRIAEIDTIILRMAICEMLKFNSIPVKVTINEYLEIAKEYSTPKSSIFINGVLDGISKAYAEEGRLNKVGKGLL